MGLPVRGWMHGSSMRGPSSREDSLSPSNSLSNLVMSISGQPLTLGGTAPAEDSFAEVAGPSDAPSEPAWIVDYE